MIRVVKRQQQLGFRHLQNVSAPAVGCVVERNRPHVQGDVVESAHLDSRVFGQAARFEMESVAIFSSVRAGRHVREGYAYSSSIFKSSGGTCPYASPFETRLPSFLCMADGGRKRRLTDVVDCFRAKTLYNGKQKVAFCNCLVLCNPSANA